MRVLGDRLLALAVRGMPFGLVPYAVVSHALLQFEQQVPRVLLPMCLLVGLAAAWLGRTGRAAQAEGAMGLSGRAPGWLWPVVVLLLASGLGFITYASVVTPDRSWDGLVFWSLRAAHLHPPVDLSQPFFASADAYSHSPHYPLLQSLLLGATQDLWGPLWGRVLFPGLFLLLLLTVLDTARKQGWDHRVGAVLLLGLGLCPIWYARGAGAVASGYADLLLCWLLVLGAAGLLRGDGRILFCVGVLLPLSKPEAMVHLGALCLVAACRRQQPGITALFWGAGLGLLLWLPLQAWLMRDDVAIFDYGAAVLVPGLLMGLRALVRKLEPGPRTLGVLALAVPALLLALAAGLQDWLAASKDPLFAVFAARAGELGSQLGQLPQLCLLTLQGLADVNKFGLSFLLLLLLLFLGGAWSEPKSRILLVLLLGNLGIAVCAMLLSPADQLEHEFRSRFDRLLLQQLALLWLCLGSGPLQSLTRSR